jgi:hypothetical protein
MSWETFKQNILRVANSPEGIADINVVAESYAKEYDAAVKRGFDRQHKIPLVSGNVEMMKQLFISALQKGVNSPTPYDLVGEMGAGVKAYWSGATMATAPLPITPAIQATVNLSVTQNIVTNPGIWQQPILSLNVDVSEELTPEKRIEYQEALEVELEKYNKFIAQNETLKATTVLDAINKFTALLNENKDYNVEVPLEQAILGIVPGQPITTNVPVPATPATDKAAVPEIISAEKSNIIDTKEKVDLGYFELDSGQSINVSVSDDEFGEIKFNQGKPFVSGFKAGGGIGGGLGPNGSYVPFGGFSGNASVGQKVVEIALHDAAQSITESPNDRGHPRIEQIQALGNGPWGGGTGFPWCACTVTTWWSEAGVDVKSVLKLKNGTNFYWPGVPQWVTWAIEAGRYVDMRDPANAAYIPKAGDAIIYDWSFIVGTSNHIGVFWKIENKKWWGIDGNKGAPGGIRSFCINDMSPVQGVIVI